MYYNNYHKTRSKLLFAILILISIVIFVLYNVYTRPLEKENKTYYYDLNSIHKNEQQTLFIKPNCSPINLDYKQFKIQIDGITYPQSLNRFRNNTINFECLNKSSRIKRILYWNSINNYNSYNTGLRQPFRDNRCPITNCEITDNRDLFNQSDIVLVRMSEYDLDKLKYLSRPMNQKWLYTLYESPFHLREIYSTSGLESFLKLFLNYNSFNNLFNLTTTYRSNSDFPGHYEELSGMYWEKNNEFNLNYDYYAEKSKFAAAVISNCNSAASMRIKYINELGLHVPVDLFGRCGKKCSKMCKETIGLEYKFYLAFENSFCTDYITEKFFSILRSNIIPVVRGLGNYELYVPRSGFINANDFESPRDLAKYLKYLDSNKTAYNSYFKWKQYVKFDTGFLSTMAPICDICIYLHLEDFFGVEKKIIQDSGYFTNIEKNCKNPKPFKSYGITGFFNF